LLIKSKLASKHLQIKHVITSTAASEDQSLMTIRASLETVWQLVPELSFIFAFFFITNVLLGVEAIVVVMVDNESLKILAFSSFD
jgi:hypothetical protein